MLCTLLITSLLSGCQVVSVKEQAINVTLNNERDSILTRDKLSEASLNVLSMTGREAQICIDQPEECVEDLNIGTEYVESSGWKIRSYECYDWVKKKGTSL